MLVIVLSWWSDRLCCVERGEEEEEARDGEGRVGGGVGKDVPWRRLRAMTKRSGRGWEDGCVEGGRVTSGGG